MPIFATLLMLAAKVLNNDPGRRTEAASTGALRAVERFELFAGDCMLLSVVKLSPTPIRVSSRI